MSAPNLRQAGMRTEYEMVVDVDGLHKVSVWVPSFVDVATAAKSIAHTVAMIFPPHVPASSEPLDRVDDATAYHVGRRLKVGDFIMEAHERGEPCGYDHCQREHCRSTAVEAEEVTK